jgi:hypothetical protein
MGDCGTQGFSSFTGDCTNLTDPNACPFAPGWTWDVIDRVRSVGPPTMCVCVCVTLSSDTVCQYFHVYYPLAISTAHAMRVLGADHYVYTTHSWLVSLYLNCPNIPALRIQCPNGTEQADFLAAILRGDITWHAYPFNAQPEVSCCTRCWRVPRRLSSAIGSRCIDVRVRDSAHALGG